MVLLTRLVKEVVVVIVRVVVIVVAALVVEVPVIAKALQDELLVCNVDSSVPFAAYIISSHQDPGYRARCIFSAPKQGCS